MAGRRRRPPWRNPPSKSRVVHYRFEVAGPNERSIDEGRIEGMLEAARRAGIVSQFDTGRGRLVWFEGCPGKALRAVRAKVKVALDRARLEAQR